MMRLAVFSILALAACSSESDKTAIPDPSPEEILYAEQARPAADRLGALYDRSCRACHALRGTGAPLTGHGAAWQVRLEARGQEGLLASTKGGRGAMPAMGLCPDCTDEDFLALIAFMSTEAQ